MPRVAKRTAAKAYPADGIAKGDVYYHWKIKMAYGGLVRRSKTYPRRSQLTLSDFLGQAYDLDDAVSAAESPDDLDSLADDVRALGEEQADKLSNMPDGLQSGSTGELLQERADQCEEWATEIDNARDAWREALDALEEGDDDDAQDFLGDCASPF